MTEVSLMGLHRGSLYKVGNKLVPLDRTGLVGFWPFEEGSGDTAYDESKNGNGGTIYGASWTYDPHFGYALDFDGADDYIKLPDKMLPITPSERTVSAWVKTDVADPSKHKRIFYTSHGEMATALVDKNPDEWEFAVKDSGGTWHATGTTNKVTTDWHHIVGVFNNSDSLKIYVDGDLENTTTISSLTLNNAGNSYGIGYQSYFKDRGFWNGKIDEVRIYSRALTENEITNIYNKTKP